MKALVGCVTAVVMLAACTQPTVTAVGGLGGSHDVLVHDSFVFMTSADKDELRVLRTGGAGLLAPQWVRAPNPLETLSIPVVPGATQLTQDMGLATGVETFDDGGVRPIGSPVVGNFIFASRPGAPAISIVSADPSFTRPGGIAGAEPVFREIRRLPTAAPVMATAGWLSADKASRLYFATFDGSSSSVFSLDLPKDTAGATLSPRHVSSFPGESVGALTVVPPLAARTLDGTAFCNAAECVVISTRGMLGATGKTLMVDPATLRSAELKFPGPVRSLTSNPQVTFRLDGDPDDMADRIALNGGERVFATLDEERCGGASCGGIIAVDTRTGSGGAFALANDSTGQAMRPITIGTALITGLAVANSVDVAVTAALSASQTAGIARYPLLGVVTGSNGDVLYFDALNLNQLDTDLDVPAITTSAMFTADGTQVDYVGGPVLTNGDGSSAVSLGDGTWASQQLIVANQGAIPGVRSLVAVSGTAQTVPSGIGTRLRVGDSVTFTTASGACVQPIAAISGDTFQVAAACPAATYFAVSAGATDPYVAQGSVSGYFGRTSPGGQLVIQQALIFRPQDQATSPTSLVMNIGPASVAPGTYWTIDIDAHFAPYVVKVDGANINCSSSALQYAVRVAWSAERQRFYMLYPSGNALMELNTSASVPRAQLSLNTGMICYR